LRSLSVGTADQTRDRLFSIPCDVWWVVAVVALAPAGRSITPSV